MVQQVKKHVCPFVWSTFEKRQQVYSDNAAFMCIRQTVKQRRSDTYREDDTSTLPPTPLHDHTSSLPCRVPGTSSMHAGCHSRRMTSFSSTMPFPLLTLNCYTHTYTYTQTPSCTPSWPAGPYCFLAWVEIHTRTRTRRQDGRHTHIHTCTLKQVQT